MKKVLLVILLFFVLISLAFAKADMNDPGPWFTFNYSIGWGMAPPGSEMPGGVEFSVWIDDGTGFDLKYKANYVKLKWYPDAINLSEYQGKDITIRLMTKHIENRIHLDYPYFGNPKLSTGPLNNLTEIKNLALIMPDNYGGIKDDGTIVKMEEEDEVFYKATVLAKTNSAEKIAIFSGEKFITVPGKSMPGLFMGINMGKEYLNVGAGPLREAYVGPLPPAVFADWKVSVPTIEKTIQTNASGEQDFKEGNINFTPSKEFIVLSSQNDVYAYKDGFSAKYDDMTFNFKANEGAGYAFSAIEISNSDKINLSLNNVPKVSPGDDNSFLGFILDFHTKDGYLNRYWLGFGCGSDKRYDKRVGSWIYDDASMSLIQRYNFKESYVDISNKINDNKITLDFKEFAPAQWDGKVWLACGAQNIDKPVEMTAKIENIKPYQANKPIESLKDIDGKFAKYNKDNITIAISKKNGALCGLWYGEERVLDESKDTYTIERLTNISNIFETYDIVKKIKNEKWGIYVECENIIAPELKIIKEYSVTDSGEYTKKTSFETKDREGFFVKLTSNGTVNPDFKKQSTGYGALVSRKVVAQGKVMETDDEAPAEQAGNGAAPVLIKKDFSLGFGAFRYKVNDRYVMRGGAKRNPTGFDAKIFTDFLKPDERVSGEVVYKFFQGNLAVFDKYYRDLPEYKALYEIDTPEWTKRMVSDAMYLQNGMEPFHKMAEPLIVTQTIWMFNSPWGNWGGYHQNPDGKFPGTHQVAPGHRSKMPNARIAKYNNFCIDEESDIYRDHLDWTVKDREGEPVSTGINSDSTHGPSFYPQILRPEMKKLLLDMHADQLRQWKLDYYYTDGPGYGQEEIDWSLMDVTQNYDWLEYVKDLYLTIKSVNPEAVIFANGLMPYSSFSYIEYRDPIWQQQLTDEWQQIALGLFQQKLEQPESNTIVPTYGTLGADPALSSYTIMYGWAGNLFTVERYPFMEAAWEYRDIKLLEDALSPNWLKEDTYFEANAFTKGEETIVNIFNHDPNKDSVKLTLDVSKTNLKVGEKVNYYYLLMNDTPKTIKQEDGSERIDPTSVVKKGFKEPVVIKWGEVCPEKIEFEVPCKHGLITSVVFTHSPALISSVNGRKTHTYLPTQLDAKIKNAKTGDSISFDTEGRSDAEIIIPGYSLGDDINTSYKTEQVIWSGMKSLKATVPKGDHSFIFTHSEKPLENTVCNIDFEAGTNPLKDNHKPEGVEYNIVNTEKGKSLNVIGNNIWTYARDYFLFPAETLGTKYVSAEFDFKVLDSKSGTPPFISFELEGNLPEPENIAFTFDDKTVYYNGVRLTDYNSDFNHVKVVIDNFTGKVSVLYNSEMWGRYDAWEVKEPEVQKEKKDVLTWSRVRPVIGTINGGQKGSVLFDNIIVKAYD
ncbi:MAG: hypothetical protein IJS60_09950 [Abditibacteriota bacterium]|nr:hypothetical protein [Abditibacteriota bacterium]